MAADCPRMKENLKMCNCSYPGCDKKGQCCECLHYHRRMGQLPGCFFSDAVERSYDRSISRFVAAQKGG